VPEAGNGRACALGRWRDARRRPGHGAVDEPYLGNRPAAEHQIGALANLRADMLHLGGEGAFDPDDQGGTGALATARPQRFRDRPARIDRPDDFRPAGEQGPARETETAEGDAAGLGQELAHRQREAACHRRALCQRPAMPVDSRIAPILLDWYDSNARALPWRVPPGSAARADPYRVWLSEVMLQQTTVSAAAPYFEAFTQRWPDLAALARADDADVMAAWAGLGYYARARNLLACARLLVSEHGGRFPGAAAELLRLPGIGAYTAAAIAAIAFGERSAVVDTNVMRVVARLVADETAPPRLRDRVAAALAPAVPEQRAGDFAQAMMDLGALVCTPASPRCDLCPVRRLCAADARGMAERLPSRPDRRPRPTRFGTAWWVEQGGAVAFVRRPDTGLLGGLLGLPGTGWEDQPPGAHPPLAGPWQACPKPVRHGFTHFTLELRLLIARPARRPARIGGHIPVWVASGSLRDAGLPTLYRKAVAAMERWRRAPALPGLDAA
jgi:A/G-specific adenine glycosylase